MERFEFVKLNDDDQLELLKYMPIKERVRFERINSDWASLLDRLWLSQKQLHFGGTITCFVPHSECHQFHLNECCINSKALQIELIVKVLSKCNNLKALHIATPFKDGVSSKELPERWYDFVEVSRATRLATVLNDSCKELEHLSIYSISCVFFELFVPSDKFTCLLPLCYDRLKILYDKKSPHNCTSSKLMALKTAHFSPDMFEGRIWSLINTVKVEHLNSIHWDAKFKDLINLNWLIIDGASSHNHCAIAKHAGHLQQLEHVSVAYCNSTQLRRIFESNRKLVALNLFNGIRKILPTIVEVGLNLKKLELDFGQFRPRNRGDSGNVFKQYHFWQDLSKLTKLQSLSLCGRNIPVIGPQYCQYYRRKKERESNLDVDGVCLVLNTCTKLKYFRFKFNCLSAHDITFENKKELICKVVANKSFRESFVVSFPSVKDRHSICITMNLGQ